MAAILIHHEQTLPIGPIAFFTLATSTREIHKKTSSSDQQMNVQKKEEIVSNVIPSKESAKPAVLILQFWNAILTGFNEHTKSVQETGEMKKRGDVPTLESQHLGTDTEKEKSQSLLTILRLLSSFFRSETISEVHLGRKSREQRLRTLSFSDAHPLFQLIEKRQETLFTEMVHRMRIS